MDMLEHINIEELKQKSREMWKCDKCPTCVFSFILLCGMDGDKISDCEDYIECWKHMDLIEALYDRMLLDESID